MLAALLGALFGFVGSMPVAGPTAALVLKSALDGRARKGLYIAVGAAVAEAIYACVAFWGTAAALTQYPFLLPVSRIVGCAILVAVGAHFATRRVSDAPPPPPSHASRDGSHLALGFTITVVNPTLLATWTAAVTVLHSTAAVPMTRNLAIPFALGVAVGVVAWFATMLALIARFRARVSAGTLGRAVRATGLVLIAVGAVLGARAIATLV